MTTIDVNNLSKSFTYYEKEVGFRNSLKNLFYRKELSKDAVSGVSFKIYEGEIVGFLGPNGAGKTTTLKMLSGILYPSGGTATVMGYIPWKRQKDFKMKFSIVMGQKSQLWADLPANETLYLNKFIYEIDDKDYHRTLDELAELLDIKGLLKVQVRRLSLGERMKLEIIAALIHKPRIIFLDEPTIGLDVISQKRIREFLKFYNLQTKTTIMITSHYMRDIEELCKRAIVINGGKKIYDGNLNEINDLFYQKKIIKLQLSDYVEKDTFSVYGTLTQYSDYSATIEVDKQNINDYSKKIMDSFPVKDINIEDIPVERGIEMLYQRGVEKNEISI